MKNDHEKQIDELQSTVESLRDNAEFQIRARDELIRELEQQLADISKTYHDRIRETETLLANWQCRAEEAEHKSGVAERDERIRELEQETKRCQDALNELADATIAEVGEDTAGDRALRRIAALEKRNAGLEVTAKAAVVDYWELEQEVADLGPWTVKDLRQYAEDTVADFRSLREQLKTTKERLAEADELMRALLAQVATYPSGSRLIREYFAKHEKP